MAFSYEQTSNSGILRSRGEEISIHEGSNARSAYGIFEAVEVVDDSNGQRNVHQVSGLRLYTDASIILSDAEGHGDTVSRIEVAGDTKIYLVDESGCRLLYEDGCPILLETGLTYRATAKETDPTGLHTYNLRAVL